VPNVSGLELGACYQCYLHYVSLHVVSLRALPIRHISLKILHCKAVNCEILLVTVTSAGISGQYSHVGLHLSVLALPQAMRCRLFTVKSIIQFQGRPQGICGGQSDTGKDSSMSNSVSPSETKQVHYHNSDPQMSFHL
jgi:hypothetical protein